LYKERASFAKKGDAVSEAARDIRDFQPPSLRHIIGHKAVVAALQVAVDAAFQDAKRLDHCLLVGPPGLGKTTFASVLARELCVPLTEILAQSITNAAELNALLLAAPDKSLLFIDEIHLLAPTHQHSLLYVLDKRQIFVSGSKSVQAVSVADFTLIGATTDPHGLIHPLAERFKLILNLQYLSTDELAEVVRQRCTALQWRVEPDVIPMIAARGRGTPRIALKLLEAARRCCRAEGCHTITMAHFVRACELEQVDCLGLDTVQQKYLHLLADGPCRLTCWLRCWA
jgi:Holliday junction DNA helicase RuvB